MGSVTPGSWAAAERALLASPASGRLDAEPGKGPPGGEPSQARVLGLAPALLVPDLDPIERADHDDLAGQGGVAALVVGDAHPALGVGLHLAGAGEEGTRRVHLEGTPLLGLRRGL